MGPAGYHNRRNDFPRPGSTAQSAPPAASYPSCGGSCRRTSWDHGRAHGASEGAIQPKDSQRLKRENLRGVDNSTLSPEGGHPGHRVSALALSHNDLRLTSCLQHANCKDFFIAPTIIARATIGHRSLLDGIEPRGGLCSTPPVPLLSAPSLFHPCCGTASHSFRGFPFHSFGPVSLPRCGVTLLVLAFPLFRASLAAVGVPLLRCWNAVAVLFRLSSVASPWVVLP